MRRALVVSVAALVLLAGSARAQDKKDDALARAVFAPELVFKYAREIGLKPPQRQAIVDVIKHVQGDLVGLQLSMAEPAQALVDLLNQPKVDESAALVQADKVLTIERDVKKMQMALLIRIKNALTPEQQAKLREIRDRTAGNDGDADQ
jgi:Spy/CpxP family protein refolding chaperone